MPSMFLQARATIDTQAADRPARVTILAYAGGIMTVPGWGPVGIELSRLERPDTINLLADHDGRLSGVVGSGRPRVERGELTVEGTLSRASGAARQIIALSADGIGWGASVGIEPLGGFDFIAAGNKVLLNGRQVTAPRNGFRLLPAARLREVSITALAADPHTSVAITAHNQGQKTMDFTAWLTARGFDPDQLTDFHRETLQAQYDAEQAAGNQAAGNQATDAMQASIGELRAELQNVRVEMLRASRPSGAVGTGGQAGGSRGDVAEAALLCHLGAEHVAAEHFGDATVQGARDLRLTSLVECLQAAWTPEMGELPRGREPFIRAAFSQALISNVLSNVQNKMLLDQWARLPILATKLARVIPANDFKQHHLMRLVGADTLFEPVTETGEIPHGALGDSSTPVQIDTYAKMFALTRRDIINDDLGALDELPRITARGSALKLESVFWTLVLANAGQFLSEANGNLHDAALDAAGLAAGVALMRAMVDGEGEPVLVEPKYLVVPPSLEAVADGLFVSRNLAVAGGTALAVQPDANIFSRKYQPEVSPYLSNDKYTGASATQWYLFADPARGPAAFVVAFLNGKQAPTVEIGEHDFNRLGLQLRGYIDFGVAQLESQGAVKSTGDGE